MGVGRRRREREEAWKAEGQSKLSLGNGRRLSTHLVHAQHLWVRVVFCAWYRKHQFGAVRYHQYLQIIDESLISIQWLSYQIQI